MTITRKWSVLCAAALAALIPLFITAYLLFWSPADISASRTGSQRVFGTTYMTMNNPYYQVLDAPVQESADGGTAGQSRLLAAQREINICFNKS